MERGFQWYAIREQERFETTVIEDFRKHLQASINRQSKRLEKIGKETTEDDFEDPRDLDSYLLYIDDQQVALGEIDKLGNELAILALFKQVEIVTNAIVDRYFPKAAKSDRHKVATLLKVTPFVKQIPHYAERDELRVLNNAIKHEGVVSKELAAFGGWGKKGNEFPSLGPVYDRLAPAVKKHIQLFAQECRKQGGVT